MWDFVMDESGAGAGFLRELRFPLPIYIPSASPQSSSLSPEDGTIGQDTSITLKARYFNNVRGYTPFVLDTTSLNNPESIHPV
jgi:hypothetical protein